MNCRHCNSQLINVFLDLGLAPPSNAYISKENISAPEKVFPLKLFVCNVCWLVQTEDYARADQLFSPDYAYFSSTSEGWLKHSRDYSNMIISELGLSNNSFVIEVASNDGYLLKNFVEKGIPCLGIEPTKSTADAAEKIGVPVLREFFGAKLGSELANSSRSADLICGNNVYAHVPDINDFTLGLKAALKPSGTITLEFPHLMRLIEGNQFDTVYHEHFSYLSLSTVKAIFEKSGLKIYNCEEIPTHGGSLRIYGSHANDCRMIAASVYSILEEEIAFGLQDIKTYENFQNIANQVSSDLKNFLLEQKRLGKTVAAYGAAAKGNTLLNYAEIGNDLISFVCDAAEAKQGKFMPGSMIPILKPSELTLRKPDWVLILPWNIAEEVVGQVGINGWGGKFLVAIPSLRVLN